MPSKYPVVTPDEAIDALKKAGFWTVKQRGSHIKMTDGVNVVIVPIHSKDLKLGTLKSILEQAGLSVEEFVEYLRR